MGIELSIRQIAHLHVNSILSVDATYNILVSCCCQDNLSHHVFSILYPLKIKRFLGTKVLLPHYVISLASVGLGVANFKGQEFAYWNKKWVLLYQAPRVTFGMVFFHW